MENSPLVLAIAQIVVLILNAILYARQKNAVDVEKRDRGVFGADVSKALRLAEEASREAKTIEVDHYRKLAALFAAQSAELEQAKAKIRALEETVSSLSNKLASRERADRSAEKRAAKEQHQELPAGPGASDVDDPVRNGMAIPLFPQQPGPAALTLPNNFGRSAR